MEILFVVLLIRASSNRSNTRLKVVAHQSKINGSRKLSILELYLYKPAVILGLQYLSRDTKSNARPSSDSGIGPRLCLTKIIKKNKIHLLCHIISSKNTFMHFSQHDSINLNKILFQNRNKLKKTL